MEVYGAVASTAALLELTTKLAKLFCRAGTAKETWQRYCDELFLIHQLATLVKDITRDMDGLRKYTTDEHGKQWDILELCDRHANLAIQGARNLLSKYCPTNAFESAWLWCENKFKACAFVIMENEIKDCMESAAAAKASLNTMLTALILEKLNTGHRDTIHNISTLKDRMMAQFQTLQDIHRENLEHLQKNNIQLREVLEDRKVEENSAPKASKMRQLVQKVNLKGPSKRRLMGRSQKATLASSQLPPQSGNVTAATVHVEGDHSAVLEEHYTEERRPWSDGSSQEIAASAGALHVQHQRMADGEVAAHRFDHDTGQEREDILEEKMANTIEVIFASGAIVHFPPDGQPVLISEPKPGNAVALVGQSDQDSELPVLGEIDAVSMADAKDLIDFVCRRESASESADPSSQWIRILDVARNSELKFIEKVTLSEGNAEDHSGSEQLQFLCLQKMNIEDGKDPSLEAIPQCLQPCCHVPVTLLGGGVTRNSLREKDTLTIVATQPIGSAQVHFVDPDGAVRFGLEGGPVDTLFFTAVHQPDRDATWAFGPRLLAWPRILVKADSDDEDDPDAVGPFSTVPCFFCRKAARRPEMVEKRSTGALVQLGTHSYGYKCARCGKISWITGTRQQGLEIAADDDSNPDGDELDSDNDALSSTSSYSDSENDDLRPVVNTWRSGVEFINATGMITAGVRLVQTIANTGLR